MDVHLIDGTYELFRHYYGSPAARDAAGREVGAIRGVLASLAGMLSGGTTHMAVATDHVIESFRNDLWPGYKTGAGIEPELLSQFHPLEDALACMGITVWAMTDLEADDALASGAELAARDPAVGRVLICTPDKDLSQCVRGSRVVQLDRRQGELRDEEGVIRKFGVPPASIPDYLALVGDSADGFPGLPRWGAKSASAVLARYGHIEGIPRSEADWDVAVRGAAALGASLREHLEHAVLFRHLATLVTDAPLFEDVGELRWTGPEPAFATLAESLGAPGLARRVEELTSGSTGSGAPPPPASR